MGRYRLLYLRRIVLDDIPMTHTESVIRTALRSSCNTVSATFVCLLVAVGVLLMCGLPVFNVLYGDGVAGGTAGWSQQWPDAGVRRLALMVAGVMLLTGAWAVKRTRPPFWPFDAEIGRRYRKLRHWNRWVLKYAVAAWLLALVLHVVYG
jgi:hypothetical protein